MSCVPLFIQATNFNGQSGIQKQSDNFNSNNLESWSIAVSKLCTQIRILGFLEQIKIKRPSCRRETPWQVRSRGRWWQLIVKLLSYQLAHWAHVGSHVTIRHLDWDTWDTWAPESRVQSPLLLSMWSQGWAWHGAGMAVTIYGPRSHNMLLTFLSWLPDLIRYVLHVTN